VRAVLILAAGYVFDAMMVVPHVLSFPGALAPSGVIGGNAQTTAWLYMGWRVGFPLFVLAYTIAARRNRELAVVSSGRAIFLSCAGVAASALALTLVATSGGDLLPVVMRGRTIRSTSARDSRLRFGPSRRSPSSPFGCAARPPCSSAASA
jgi:hypothetical protein